MKYIFKIIYDIEWFTIKKNHSTKIIYKVSIQHTIQKNTKLDTKKK